MTENVRGVIAESYAELQGLSVLEEARRCNPLPPATWDSCVRAILQSVEIGLLNVSDLLRRAAVDVRNNQVDEATTKMFWVRGFHRVLVRLSLCPGQLGLSPHRDGASCQKLLLADSPAIQEFVAALRQFDAAVLELIGTGGLPAGLVLADHSLGSARFNMLHLARICSHESTIWEEQLAELPISEFRGSYADYIAAPVIRAAVYDRVLRGDTFFTQFRGLHQIPETIGEEVNDQIAAGIAQIRGGSLRRAVEHLGAARALTEVIESCLPPMVDSLATSDYHEIRENLGLTSGSHSICIRYDMFTQLYTQLAGAVSTVLLDPSVAASSGEVDDALDRIARERFDDPAAGDAYILVGHCVALRSFIFHWRALHLHLPRNNLGGDQTRSLTGSVDAVKAVAHLRETAISRDPFAAVARWWGGANTTTRRRDVATYVQSEDSLDGYLLKTTGALTQGSFTDVQERSGFFAQRCAFTPPAARRA